MTPARWTSCVRASERPTIESLIRLSVRTAPTANPRPNAGSGFDPGNKLSDGRRRHARTMGPGKHFCSDFCSGSVCGHDRCVYVYLSGGFADRPLSLRLRMCTQPAARNSRNISCQDKYGAGKSGMLLIRKHLSFAVAPVRGIPLCPGAHFPAQVLLYLLPEHSDWWCYCAPCARLLTPVTDALTYANIIVRRLLFRGRRALLYIPVWCGLSNARALSLIHSTRAANLCSMAAKRRIEKKNQEFPGLRRLSALCFIGKVDYAHLSCLTRFHAQNTTWHALFRYFNPILSIHAQQSL